VHLKTSLPIQPNLILHCQLIFLSYRRKQLSHLLRVISGFRREEDKNCALLGYYAASSGNFLLMFRNNLTA
jgi:hypothetical protein